jgi:hypothetical protein
MKVLEALDSRVTRVDLEIGAAAGRAVEWTVAALSVTSSAIGFETKRILSRIYESTP